jgi:hypothetical protein
MRWEERRINIKFIKSEKNMVAYDFLTTISYPLGKEVFEISHDKLNAVDTGFITGN